MRLFGRAMLFALFLAFAGVEARAEMTTVQKEKYMSEEFPRVVRLLEPAVVTIKIKVLGEVDVTVGSGFYVSYDGVVATARHLLASVAEPGTVIEVSNHDGSVVTNPKLLGCSTGKLELCFLHTGALPTRWFSLDASVGYIDGQEAFVLGNTLAEKDKLIHLAIAKIRRQKFPKPHELTLSVSMEPELAGAPIFDLYGKLLGIVTDHGSPASAVGITTMAERFRQAQDLPRESVALVKKRRAEEIHNEALALRRLTSSQASRLAAGKSADKKHFRYVDFAANGVKLSLPVPKQINPKSCRREGAKDGATFLCGAGRTQIRVTVNRYKNNLRYLDREPAGEPRVIDLVAQEMRMTPTYWEKRMRELPPNIRTRLASNPGNWSCREEAEVASSALLPRAFRCRVEEHHYGDVGTSVARFLLQAPELDSTVEFAAIGDGAFSEGLWSLVKFMARGTKVRQAGAGRGIASVMTPAGRLQRTRDFCYVNSRYCWLKTRSR